MKKLLLLFSVLLGLSTVKAQTPEAIYLATWTTMSELGSPITPNDEDPKLTYDAESGCYQGEVIDWQRLAVNPYNAKIPYSVEDGVITYYGVVGSTQQFNFNTVDSQSFQFTSSTNPSGFKGFGLSMQNSQGVVDVKVSMNLASNTITFTKFESGEGTEIPTLLSVVPESGSAIATDEDGGASVTLTFSSAVTSLEALSDGMPLETEVSEDGKVWTILISPKMIEEVTSSSLGLIALTVQKAYVNDLPVSFENGSPFLNLVYTLEGVTHEATFIIKGDEKGVESLKIYKYPEYSVGDEVDFEGNTLNLTYTQKVTYLFTVGTGYEISISSDIESDEGENWMLGEGYSTKKGPNGETTNQKAADGVTLTLFAGASDGIFTIELSSKSGIDNIQAESGIFNVYSVSGAHILTSDKENSLDSLAPGIYIINGKKVLKK